MDMGQMSNCILLSVTRSCDLLVCSLGLLSQSRDGHPRFADTFGDPLLIEAFQNHDGQAAPDANLIPVPKPAADAAMDAAACIGCGACVAACPNGAAQLFVAAKVANLNLLPQGQPERWTRVEAMVDEMERYFGSCTNHGECEEACPKRISLDFIAMMNKDYVKAKFKNRRMAGQRS